VEVLIRIAFRHEQYLCQCEIAHNCCSFWAGFACLTFRIPDALQVVLRYLMLCLEGLPTNSKLLGKIAQRLQDDGDLISDVYFAYCLQLFAQNAFVCEEFEHHAIARIGSFSLKEVGPGKALDGLIGAARQAKFLWQLHNRQLPVPAFREDSTVGNVRPVATFTGSHARYLEHLAHLYRSALVANVMLHAPITVTLLSRLDLTVRLQFI
jgi:hypothetical protein